MSPRCVSAAVSAAGVRPSAAAWWSGSTPASKTPGSSASASRPASPESLGHWSGASLDARLRGDSK